MERRQSERERERGKGTDKKVHMQERPVQGRGSGLPSAVLLQTDLAPPDHKHFPAGAV